MIDLHIHTTNSDGTCTVKEILEKAEEKKLEWISITDHESCKAYEELEDKELRRIFSGRIIPGVEIKSAYNKRIIDILGYDIDTEKMSKWLNEFYAENTREKIQTKYLKKQYEGALSLGLKLIPFDEIKWNPEKDWASVTIYEEIGKFEENRKKFPDFIWEKFDNFKQNYCQDMNSPFYIDKSADYPTVKQTIQKIHECGGKAFLAHAFIYKWAENKEEFIMDVINNYGIDGVECYYSKFTEENISMIEDITSRTGRFRSGGTDYHGEHSPGIELGVGKGNLKIETKNTIENWYKKEGI